MSDSGAASNGSEAFGACCHELKEAISSEDFEPLLTVGDDGVLYMSIGLVDEGDDEGQGYVDHPVFFCPFCGTQLQAADDVAGRMQQSAGADDGTT